MKYFITIVAIIAAIAFFFSPEQVANRQIAVEKAKQEKLREETELRLKAEAEVMRHMTDLLIQSMNSEMADTLDVTTLD